MFRFLLLFSVLFMGFDISADDECRDIYGSYSSACDYAEDTVDIFQSLTTLVAIGAVGMVIVSAASLGEAAADSENLTFSYDFVEEKITFEGHTKLENFEINFSNPMLKNDFQQQFKINEDTYIGVTWRF
jgi:hypothetical protein